MGKFPMVWWILVYISCFSLLGNGGAGNGLTLAMKGRPYYKEDAIIKTFEFDGDIIDCVDIYKQPAFDHPLLKNHTIQMKPTFAPKSPMEYLKATTMNGSMVEDTHPWLFTKGCPEGSIPITRMAYMNGLVGNNATAGDSHIHFPRYIHKHGGTKDKKFHYRESHEYASLGFTANKFYGASAELNVYRPRVEVGTEFSLAQIWIVSRDATTALEAGWIVSPSLYGDDRTRFFTLWTSDGRTLCYNLQCPGFVWTNHNIRLDTVLQHVSVHGGEQHEIHVEIYLERPHGRWWLRFERVAVGYWPGEIVPKIRSGAYRHEFGGVVLNRRTAGRHTSTQMGSGHFATQEWRKSAFIKNIQVSGDGDHSMYGVPSHHYTVVTQPNCYNLELGEQHDFPWGFFFYYGGPGRSARCT